MTSFKVSVIIPCFKVEKYLERCMESIVNQSLRDIEIILVDDKSPDSTPELCDEWQRKDSRIRVVHKPNNEGLGFARNTGMEVATGEYISFVDSDDWFEPDMIERLYNECKKSNLDVIYSEFNVDEYPGFRVMLRPVRIYEGREEIEQLRLDIVGAEPSFASGVKFQCSACKGLFKRSLIENNNVRFLSERQYISEDMIFNLDVLYYAEKVKTVPWQLYHYCLNGASLSHTYRADRWERQMIMLDKLKKDTIVNNKKELQLRIDRTTIFYLMCATRQERKRNDISMGQIMANIRGLLNDPHVVSVIEGYPIQKLPIKWKVYTLAAKYKSSLLIYLLSMA